MNESAYEILRASFRAEIAEMPISGIREYTRKLRILTMLNFAQIDGLLEDLRLMADYKSKDHSAAQSWESIERGWKKTV